MEKSLINEICEKFGKKQKDDCIIDDGSIIVYKGKNYKVQKKGVIINVKDKNSELLKSISEAAEALEELLALDPNALDEDSCEGEGGPYPCEGNVEILFDETINSLRVFLDSTEEGLQVKRLEKPDFIAFYRPFHFNPLSWGIYLDQQKLVVQGLKIYNYNRRNNIVTELTIRSAIILSFFKTYFHEMYHHKMEMFGTKLDIATRRSFYNEGIQKFYCSTFGTDSCLEEAFANVHGTYKSIDYIFDNGLIDRVSPISKYIELIRKSLLFSAPPGYRVSFELTSPQKEFGFHTMMETRFLEILYYFSFRRIYGQEPLELTNGIWKLSTYKLDPLVNTDNQVTFILPA